MPCLSKLNRYVQYILTRAKNTSNSDAETSCPDQLHETVLIPVSNKIGCELLMLGITAYIRERRIQQRWKHSIDKTINLAWSVCLFFGGDSHSLCSQDQGRI